MLTTKKDGSPRFCVDYRRFKTVMKRDRWPMPGVDEIFDEINGSTVFTTIDLPRILADPDGGVLQRKDHIHMQIRNFSI